MAKPRKVATFTFDNRGWAHLYKHIVNELERGRLDKDLYELHFTGSRTKTQSDLVYFAKTLGMFSTVKTLVLKDMGLASLDVLGKLLCTKFTSTKLLDISNNNLSKAQLQKLIDALQGRSITKEVPPIWLAIGNMPELSLIHI